MQSRQEQREHRIVRDDDVCGRGSDSRLFSRREAPKRLTDDDGATLQGGTNVVDVAMAATILIAVELRRPRAPLLHRQGLSP
jgi:hypothetical protein